MATSRTKKLAQLQQIEALFTEAEGIAFTTFSGATVDQVQTIRRDLRSKDMTYLVAKKTLLALAAKNTGKAEFNSDQLPGAVAVIISQTDSVAPAAAVKQLIKDTFDKDTKTSVFNFAGSVFEGQFLDIAGTKQLADTPSREESLGKIVGMLKHGPSGIHRFLIHGLRGITMACKEADTFTK